MKATNKRGNIQKTFNAWNRNKEFRKAIEEIRESYDIPSEGLKDQAEYKIWLPDNEVFYEGVRLPLEVLRRMNVEYQSVSIQQLKDYVLFGHHCTNETSLSGDDIEMDQYTKTGGDMNQPEQIWQSDGKAYAKLLIGEHATLEKVRKYLDTHWHIIQGSIRSQVDKESKKRRSSNMDEIHAEIRRLAKQELDTSNIITKGYKRERYIQAYIQERYGTTLEIGNIRRIMSN